MTTTIRAIYERGVLRPVRPLSLTEGQNVEVTLNDELEDEILVRMKAAGSLAELFAIADEIPPSADGYDLCRALNENRRLEGRPLVYPDLDREKLP